MNTLLQQQCKQCKLSGIYEHYDRIAQESTKQQWSQEQFLQALLEEELLNRANNRYRRLLKRAGFPTVKTVAQFDFSKAPYLDKQDILELHQCHFMEHHTNLLFVGAPGTGKSHLSLSIANEACRKGKTVAFYTAASLGNQLVEMQEEKQLNKFLQKLMKIELLLIDELGYIQLSNATTQLLFQVFSNRYEKGSTLITTNLDFAQWSELFHDTRMTAAILDRLVHNSKIVVFQGDSYRLQMHKKSDDLLGKE